MIYDRVKGRTRQSRPGSSKYSFGAYAVQALFNLTPKKKEMVFNKFLLPYMQNKHESIIIYIYTLSKSQQPSKELTRFSLISPKMFGQSLQFPFSRASQYPPVYRKGPSSPSL